MSFYTKEEARKKTCPFPPNEQTGLCQVDKCMMWRWSPWEDQPEQMDKKEKWKGYCGLAGGPAQKPQEPIVTYVGGPVRVKMQRPGEPSA